jgi:hypothetical protein
MDGNGITHSEDKIWRSAHKIAMEEAKRNKLLDRIMDIELIQLAKFWSYEVDNKPLGFTKTNNFFTSWATINPPKVDAVNFKLN